jgi:TRAP transporter TAXI family solute receptor
MSASFQYGGAGDQGNQLADGRLDALLLAGGSPHPTYKELEATKQIEVFGFDESRLNTIRKAFPDVVPFEIPGGTYKGQSGKVLTGAMWNIVVVNKSMSPDLAYNIVKAVFANRSRLMKTHSAAKDTLPENILKNTAVPLHPGALRFYKEQGIQIPSAIQPPA